MSGGGSTDNAERIEGGSDGTIIGNIGDRLKVSSLSTIVSIASGVNAFTQYLRYNDMNASTGGIARGTTVVANSVPVKVYSYTGFGVFTGFTMSLGTANSGWYIDFRIDTTNNLFGASPGILSTDINNTYGLAVGTQNISTYGIGLSVDASLLYFSSPTYSPIRFDSSLEIYVTRLTGAGNKTFNGGLIAHTKEP